MKDELISLCADLEHHFDHRLNSCDDRLERLEKKMSECVDRLVLSYPKDEDVRELAHLRVGLRNTQRVLHGKLEAIKDSSDQLLSELSNEVTTRMPDIREKIKNSASYEQATLEIQREMHTGTKSFRDFFRGLLLWKESPEEHLEAQARKSPRRSNENTH